MRERIVWMDALRAVATLWVVANHTSVPHYWAFEDETAWLTGLWVHVFSASAVPLFFMLSGALSFSKPPSGPRRILRVAIPCVAYNVVYALVNRYRDGDPWRSPTSYLSVPAQYHLWFFAPMLLVTALTLVVRPSAPSRSGLFVVVALFLCNAHAFRIVGIDGPLDEPLGMLGNVNQVGILLAYFLYAVLGHELASVPSGRKTALLSGLAFVIVTLLMARYAIRASRAEQTNVGTSFDNLGVLCLVQAASAFLFIREQGSSLLSLPMLGSCLKRIAERSLGIYGIHIVVLETVRPFSDRVQNPALFVVATTALVVASSWALARVAAFVDRRGSLV